MTMMQDLAGAAVFVAGTGAPHRRHFSSSSSSSSTNTSDHKHRHVAEQTRMVGRSSSSISSAGNRDGSRSGGKQQQRLPAKTVLLEIAKGISNLLKRAEGLDELPPLWLWSNGEEGVGMKGRSDDDDELRKEIFDETNDLVDTIVARVRDGTIRPTRNHGSAISVLLENILTLYGHSCCRSTHSSGRDDEDGGSDSSVYDECKKVLELMREWKVDLQHKHSEQVATVAAREGRWKESAELFLDRIDPEHSGFAPYDVSVSNPVGLYAIARYAQERGSSVVDSVFDAVLRMSMVSSTDQSKCMCSPVLCCAFLLGNIC